MISICIPTYNGEDFIAACIISCINQTYTDIEIIINDDCSADKTISIAEEFAKRDSRIKIFKNPDNVGLVNNWNTTIQKATAEWIKPLFQDDILHDNAIEEFVISIQSGHFVYVCKRNFKLPVDTTKEVINYYNVKLKTLHPFVPADKTLYYFSPEFVSRLAIKYIALNFIAEPSFIFFHKKIITKSGLYDNQFIQICDNEFNVRVASNFGIGYINKILCDFSIHQNSTTSTNLQKNHFQLRYIEPVVFAHKMLFHDSFYSLRKHLNIANKIRLNIYYLFRKCEAFYSAKKNFIYKNEYESLKRKFIFLKLNTFERITILPLIFILSLKRSIS